MGVPVGLHYSWFLIAALITMSLGVHFGRVNPDWGAMLSWTLAVSTALLFFASLLVHELSHAAVARARGVPVQGITLFALGGVARIEQDAGDARTEFWMAIRPDAAASDALELMFRAGVNEVPVVEDGRLCGSVSRTHVLQVLRSRAEALS
jgi:Zn-dependent protease